MSSSTNQIKCWISVLDSPDGASVNQFKSETELAEHAILACWKDFHDPAKPTEGAAYHIIWLEEQVSKLKKYYKEE
jgi:hypothetical protein